MFVFKKRYKLLITYFFIFLISLIPTAAFSDDISYFSDKNFPGLSFEERNNLVRYMATSYNYGFYATYEKTKEVANRDNYWYDDIVLRYYRYFNGEISLDYALKSDYEKVPTTAFSTPSIQTTINTKKYNLYKNAVRDEVKNFLEKNVSKDYPANDFYRYFNMEIPVNYPIYREQNKYAFNPEILTNYPGRTELIRRLTTLMNYYISFENSTFNYWFYYVFQDKNFKKIDLGRYISMLADTAYTYTKTKMSFQAYCPPEISFYKNKVTMYNFPPELLLAISVAESKLGNQTFRVEADKNNTAFAVSVGLTHVLMDVDTFMNIKMDGFGDQKYYYYTFDYVTKYYLDGNYTNSSRFSWQDLLTMRGSFLFTSILGQLSYEKYFEYPKLESFYNNLLINK